MNTNTATEQSAIIEKLGHVHILSLTVKLQTVLNLISDWATNWQLSISISKCNILALVTPYAPCQIDTKVLPHVTSCKDLWVSC